MAEANRNLWWWARAQSWAEGAGVDGDEPYVGDVRGLPLSPAAPRTTTTNGRPPGDNLPSRRARTNGE